MNNRKFRICVTDSMDNYRKVLEYVKTNDMNGNTYTPKDEKPISLLVRNLEFNTGITEENIKTEYSTDGFVVIKAVKWSTKSMAEKNRFFWLVQFDPKTDMKKLNAKKLLCNISVRYEKPTSKLELMQCRNCKQFQHSHTSCFRPFRCIKCPETHAPGACSLPSSSKPYCCNCKGEHPANSPRCPHYLRLLERIKGTKSSNEPVQTHNEKQINTPNTYITVGKRNKPMTNRRKAATSSRATTRKWNNVPMPPAPKQKPKKEDRLSKIERQLEALLRIAAAKGLIVN